MPSPSGDVWDPELYLRFAGERARPLEDLLARVQTHVQADGRAAPRRVLDVGCGTGAALERIAAWRPGAVLHGLDSSPAMVQRVQQKVPQAEVAIGDLMQWQPDGHYDLVVSNAVLHWVDDQAAALLRIAGWCGPAGVLAVQIPDNRDAPAARAVRELLAAPQWRTHLGEPKEPSPALPPEHQVRLLADAGFHVDAWTTTYLHVLPDVGSVVAWLAGTTLRPQLALFQDAPALRRSFFEAVHAAVAPVVEPVPGGVLFPFRRVFAVARRPLDADPASTPS